MNPIYEMKKAINIYMEMNEEQQRDVIFRFASEARDDAYDNAESLAGLLMQYEDEPESLKIINETLIALSGWSLESVIDQVSEYDYDDEPGIEVEEGW